MVKDSLGMEDMDGTEVTVSQVQLGKSFLTSKMKAGMSVA